FGLAPNVQLGQALGYRLDGQALAVDEWQAGSLPRWPGKLWQAAGLFARSYRADSYVLAALGEERLEAVRLREGGRVREIACERLACGFGLAPNVQLGQALGYRLDGQALAVDEWQAGSLP
ncbi:hypothetical protein Q2T49_34195, partial [Pseudomonas aeruginosa]|nr:hypothetical protein [Pseudomonas aeruginosa]